MNKNNAKDYLPLVQALAEGKQIQLKTSTGVWESYEDFDFCLPLEYYRIKPEPVKLYVATYFYGGKFHVSQPANSRSDIEDMAHLYSSFKIHELDCGGCHDK